MSEVPGSLTSSLRLPMLAAEQAQKHVTVNEALAVLDALVQLSVESRGLSEAPAEAIDGARYIVAANPAGEWAGHGGEIAVLRDGVWSFHEPRQGWLAWVADEAVLLVFDGAGWTATSGNMQNLTRLGVGTTADATNPFAAKLNKALWTARSAAEGGDGDLRLTMNKETAGDVLSLLMQSGFSGRAELGLTGDDNLTFKVSADGAIWTEALKLDRSDGKVLAPRGLKHASGKALKSFLPTPGGDGVVSLFRLDAARDPTPRGAAIASVSGDTITLSTGVAATLFQQGTMAGVSNVRIWNTSKGPAQSAWVKAQPSANSLQVTAAASIATWTSGEALAFTDPVTVTPGGVIAVDVSPLMQAVVGQVFRQSAVVLKALASGTATSSVLASPDGTAGSFLQLLSFPGGALNVGQMIVPCTQLSPVSNSNLIFVRETGSPGAITIQSLSCSGMFVD